MNITYIPIGTIHSPFTRLEDMPIQPAGAAEVRGRVELLPHFEPGLQDLDGFSHIVLLYHFHQVLGFELLVTPFLDDQPRGLFATRAPRRPNPLGLSVVRLLAVEGTTLQIQGVDVLDGTPLLDLKPHVPAFEVGPVERLGWLEQAADKARRARSDRRFTDEG
jgi:tRNA-Thr(GGU) m(6)t(6)A37 methyltransferase TsaA